MDDNVSGDDPKNLQVTKSESCLHSDAVSALLTKYSSIGPFAAHDHCMQHIEKRSQFHTPSVETSAVPWVLPTQATNNDAYGDQSKSFGISAVNLIGTNHCNSRIYPSPVQFDLPSCVGLPAGLLIPCMET